MLSQFSKIILFLSSYAPLTLAFGVLYLRTSRSIAIVLFAACALSVLLLHLMLREVRTMAGEPLVVKSSSRRDTDTLSYLATYLIPFALSPPKDAYEAGALAIFLVVLAYLYINSNMIYINPVLSVFGYHLFEVALDGQKSTIVLLAKSTDDLPENVNAVELSRRIYIARDLP